MLLAILATEFQNKKATIQAQIKELQAEEEKVQSELHQIGDREIRMTNCLETVREILEDSQKRPQEALIFSSALDDELNTFGFGNLGNDPNELEELKDKLRRVTADRDHLLIKLGEARITAQEDAVRRIAELEARVTELDNSNWEIEKRYTQVNDLWLQADKKRGELQAQLDEVMSKQEPETEAAPELTTDPEQELNAVLNPMREILGLPTQPVAEVKTEDDQPEAEAEIEEDDPPSEAQLTYSQGVLAIASDFFKHEINSKAGLKKAIRNHPDTTFMQALSLETTGKAFYEAAAAQIERLKGQHQQEPGQKQDATPETEPQTPAEAGNEDEAEQEPVTVPTPADIQPFTAGMGELLSLPPDCLKVLCDRRGIDSEGSTSELVSRLNGRVPFDEFAVIAAIAQRIPVELLDSPQEFVVLPQTDTEPEDPELAADDTEEDFQPQSIHASAGELLDCKAGQLRAFARQHALPSTGTKEQLAARLEGYVTLRELNQALAA